MFGKTILPRLAAALLCLGLAACGDPVAVAQKARLGPDSDVGLAAALARYPFFTRVSWSSRADESGGIVVEAACDLNVSAVCRKYGRAALATTTAGVARDYLLFRFAVSGLPRRARLIDAQHVTECACGKILRMEDPGLLRAVYNREEITAFCLEGLNCPGR